MFLTNDAWKVITVARELGGRPLIVGGAVRDTLLGVKSKDIDIEVHGLTSLDTLADKLGGLDEIGKSFGVLKFHGVDISLPRRDSKTGVGHTGFTVEFDPTLTITDALARRDFTINAMAFDPTTEELIDPFGGETDLNSGVLRHTSAAFSEDPLRVLRGVQFAARFGFTFAGETAQLCQSLVNSFHELSVERVWAEWEKILTKGRDFRKALFALAATGWIEHFPEFMWFAGGLANEVVGRKPAIILARGFLGIPNSAQSFLKQIGAPLDLRRDVATLGQDLFELTPERRARRLAPHCDTHDFDLVHGTSFAFEAQALGVDRAPRPRIITGETLMRWGLKPGPRFGALLKTFELGQDNLHFHDERSAIRFAVKQELDISAD